MNHEKHQSSLHYALASEKHEKVKFMFQEKIAFEICYHVLVLFVVKKSEMKE